MIPILRESFQYFPIEYEVSRKFFIYFLFMLRKFSSIISLLSVSIVKGVGVLKWLSCTKWDDHEAFSSILLMLCIILIDFHVLNYPYIPRKTHFLVMTYNCFWCAAVFILLVLCWKFCTYIHRDIDLLFSFLVMYWFVFGVRVVLNP